MVNKRIEKSRPNHIGILEKKINLKRLFIRLNPVLPNPLTEVVRIYRPIRAAAHKDEKPLIRSRVVSKVNVMRAATIAMRTR